MVKNKILLKVKEKINIINNELENGYGTEEQNQMIIEEVINSNLPTIINSKKIKNYTGLNFLEKALNEIKETLEKIKEEAEYKKFLYEEKNFDIDKLRKDYYRMELKKRFPKLKIEKFLEILNNPILEMTNFRGEVIKYDLYWIKKNLIAIIQMIFNEMDIYILNIGKEGSGKSCWSSQQILYYYNLLYEVGLIDYAYDVKKLFFADILTFLEEHRNQDKNDFFKIECLDEGNELNRANFREEPNQQFKYEMRTERKSQRIILINVQQIGELDTSISLSRVNFIYNCKMKSNKKLGTLEKGFIDMYIIPRGNNIYSEKNKKVLSSDEILNKFATKLDKKKDYYIGLPNDMIVKSFKFENKWGFDKTIYDDHVKGEMQKRKFQKNMKLTDIQAYIFMIKLSNFIKLGTFDRRNKQDDKMYKILNQFFKKITKYFESNPEKQLAIEKQYRKVYKEVN